MVSIKSALSCIRVDTSGEVSVLSAMFGFWRERVPEDPCNPPSNSAEVSVLDQIRSLRGRHMHLNVIRVGSDNFTADDFEKIDYAVYRAREIYAAQELGVGRVEHHDVLAVDAEGLNVLGKDGQKERTYQEAQWLIEGHGVDNDGIDAFIVETMHEVAGVIFQATRYESLEDKGGFIAGDCDEDSRLVARVFSHELGHYLGLPHPNEKDVDPVGWQLDNLMIKSRWWHLGATVCGSVQLRDFQGEEIRTHPLTRRGCLFLKGDSPPQAVGI